MNKILRNLGNLLAVVLVLGAVFFAGYWVGTIPDTSEEVFFAPEADFDLQLPGEAKKRVITQEEVTAQVEKIAQLATYSSRYTVTRTADTSRLFLEQIPLPGTTNSITLQCEGIVKVGFDFTGLQPSVDNESGTIYIALPQAQVLDNYVIWSSVTCRESNNILNPICFEQYQQLITEAEAEGLAQAEEAGIYQAADAQLRELLTSFLSGFSGYTVVFL